MKHLPLPGTAEVEHEFWAELDGASLVGKIDARFEENGTRVVLDNKTTSNLQWAKSEDDLRTDIQASIYAAAEMDTHGVDQVELRWIYYVTKGKAKSRKVSLVVTRDEVQKSFERINPLIAEMIEAHASGKSAKDLPYNATACHAYGGCAYRDECNLTPMERLKARMAQETILEKLKREKAEKAAASAPPVEAAPPAPAPEPKAEPPKAATKPRATGINPPEGKAAPAAAPNDGLRDMFATQAMTALLSIRDPRTSDEIARTAYDMARAMMQARAA